MAAKRKAKEDVRAIQVRSMEGDYKHSGREYSRFKLTVGTRSGNRMQTMSERQASRHNFSVLNTLPSEGLKLKACDPTACQKEREEDLRGLPVCMQ